MKYDSRAGAIYFRWRIDLIDLNRWRAETAETGPRACTARKNPFGPSVNSVSSEPMAEPAEPEPAPVRGRQLAGPGRWPRHGGRHGMTWRARRQLAAGSSSARSSRPVAARRSGASSRPLALGVLQCSRRPPGRAGGRPVTSRWYRKNFFIFCTPLKESFTFAPMGHFGHLVFQKKSHRRKLHTCSRVFRLPFVKCAPQRRR